MQQTSIVKPPEQVKTLPQTAAFDLMLKHAGLTLKAAGLLDTLFVYT